MLINTTQHVDYLGQRLFVKSFLTFSQLVFTDIINNRQSIDKRIIEITTLLSLSNNEKEFKAIFKKKFKQSLPNLNKLFNKNYDDTLFDFDKKIKKALNFNWKEEKNG